MSGPQPLRSDYLASPYRRFKVILICWGMMAVGSGGALCGGLFGVLNSIQAMTAKRAEATLVRLEWSEVRDKNGEVSRVVHPVYQYKIAGKLYEIRSEAGSNPPRNAVGERCGVLYYQGRPEAADFNTFAGLVVFPMLMIFGGLVFFAVGFGLRWLF